MFFPSLIVVNLFDSSISKPVNVMFSVPTYTMNGVITFLTMLFENIAFFGASLSEYPL